MYNWISLLYTWHEHNIAKNHTPSTSQYKMEMKSNNKYEAALPSGPVWLSSLFSHCFVLPSRPRPLWAASKFSDMT